MLFTLALFTCVLMHEYGHALTARHFNIPTKDITIMALGGVARLMMLRTTPTRELLIAIAGPLVNVVIVVVLGAGLLLAYGTGAVRNLTFWSGDFLFRLLLVNIALVVFNLIPSFPMDGGRVLRALLAYMMDYVTATTVAVRLGQVVAAIFVVVAFNEQSILLGLIGVMVFMSARRELMVVKMLAAQSAIPGRDQAS